MKLLGWMHRKFRQNNGDSGRDLATVSACLYCLSGRPSPDERRPNPSPTFLIGQDPLPSETEPPPPELTASILLDGLLHIGTFGSPIEIPETEKPPSAVRNQVAAKETDQTTTADQSELMAISAELERVIAAESEKEKASGERLSSGSARTSHAGSVGKVSDACPLRDFLFGSTVEAVAKRRRGSLGELFMRSRAAEEEGRGGAPPGAEEMKRMVKGRGSICDGGGGAAGKCGVAETKMHNILRIFHRKIHPENSIASKKLMTKPAKYEINRDHKRRTIHRSSSRSSISDYGRQVLSPKRVEEKKSFSRFKDSRPTIVKSNSTGNREQWIKTDADYLVLEL